MTVCLTVVLISTYEMGRQPFGLASPAAWLRRAGVRVTCVDLSVEKLPTTLLQEADLIAFYLPMHTATRKAVQVLSQIKGINPRAFLCFYGLYASMNSDYLRSLGANVIISGEFEEALVKVVQEFTSKQVKGVCSVPAAFIHSLPRQQFIPPYRDELPSLDRYAHLILSNGAKRQVGYTEASRGCKHNCRHCPVVTVYQGHFRIVQRDVVLADIDQQVDAGAQHITFGDPDFFNGVGHAMSLARSLHQRHPGLTYDVTIKIEHLLKYSQHLEALRDTGCLFITSAVESIDDRVLRLLDKGHTCEDFLAVRALFRKVGLTLNPTFVTFTPWTTWKSYRELLNLLAEEDLIHNVAPIQLAIRLLIPSGSGLLQLREVREVIGSFKEAALSYAWNHADPSLDELCNQIRRLVKAANDCGLTRRQIFSSIWELAYEQGPPHDEAVPHLDWVLPRAAIPYLDEPWYC